MDSLRKPALSRHDSGEKREKSGNVIVVRMNALHSSAEANGKVQPPSKARKPAGADNDRRRLSIIFHRPTSGIARWRRSPSGPPPAEDPRQQLPITARPAILARHRDVVARGKFVDDLDIGGQTRPSEDTLQKIVTEQRIFRNSSGERGLEDIDIVDPLPQYEPSPNRSWYTSEPRRRRDPCRSYSKTRAGTVILPPVGNDGVTRG